jgi:hypothetical protein
MFVDSHVHTRALPGSSRQAGPGRATLNRGRLLFGCALLLAWTAPMAHADTTVAALPSIQLAADGKALQRIVISGTASPRVKGAARALADYLGRIAHAPFEVGQGNGQDGIAVGTASQFPALGLEGKFDAPDLARREQYLLQSHARGLWVIGATDLAVEHAVWDLLYRLGYRQFFPGAHWEIVPSNPNLAIAVDAIEQPAYYSRRIWYGYGDWPDVRAAKVAWDDRNRMKSGIDLHTGHSYEGIISANQAGFDEHPEYLCSSNSTKFRISNPGLRKLVVDHALRHFEKNPRAESISLEPSDGGGWSCPEDEAVFKSVSDRVITLANEVADAVGQRFPNKYVGLYAYNQHSPPPTIGVHSNVIVSVATAFIKGGFTVEQLLSGWSRQGAMLGVREYYSVVIWHKERPGGSGASDPRRVARTITRYHELGARFMSSESSDSWGPSGLGYYVASRLLWNPREDVEAIFDDFFEKAFGPVQVPMREFYRLIDRSSRPLFTRHLVGCMYRQLEAARKLTDDPAIRSRLDDLVLYTRYVELLWDLQQGDDRLVGTKNCLSFAYRIRDRHMVHSLSLWRDLRGWSRIPSDYAWSLPEPKLTGSMNDTLQELLGKEDSLKKPDLSETMELVKDHEALAALDPAGEGGFFHGVAKAPKTNPWKSSAPFTGQDIEDLISRGKANNPVAAFTPVQFSDDLVPAAGRLKLKPAPPSPFDSHTRGRQVYYAWLDAPGTLSFEVTGGQISTNGTPQVTLSLYAMEDPTASVVATAQAPLDLQPHPVPLVSSFKGLHRVELLDAGRGAGLTWPAGTMVTIPSSGEMQTLLRGRGWKMCFYVPRGTTVIGGVAQGSGDMLDGDGSVRHTFAAGSRQDYFSVPVPPGQDGAVWTLKFNGKCLLMTVPPYLARCAAELLLPVEVVDADAAKP